MKGERLLWFQVAACLHSTVAALKDQLTYSEFIDWTTFLQLEEERCTKQDFYLAQVAAEVRRTIAKDPKGVVVEDFLLKRASTSRRQRKKPEQAQDWRKSKATWAKALGLKIKK